MSILHKLGIGPGGSTERQGGRSVSHGAARNTNSAGSSGMAVGSSRGSEMQGASRVSNGLKEFLWNLDGIGRGTLLDLGPAWQTTLNFFIERGFRVTSEDFLRGWVDFLKGEEEREKKEALTPDNFADRTPEARAKRFLDENLQYPVSSFDALLLWDILDYLDPLLAKQTVAHLTEMLRPGAVVLAMFHSKKPTGFDRYRVVDTNTLQVLESKPILAGQKIYQNREIQDLFSRYRSTKSFVGRDQLREVLFMK